MYEDKLGQSGDRILSCHITNLDIVFNSIFLASKKPALPSHGKTKKAVSTLQIYFMTSRLRVIHV